MTKILDERYKQIVDDEILNLFNTLSTSINAKANSSDVYTKLETDEQIRLKVAEIVAGAPSDFDTLKEMSDWLNTHAESAAAMNVQIQDNTTKITKLQSEIQSQSTTIGTHENKISVLTNNVSSLSIGLSAATQNISNAQADIDNNSDDISALKERVALNESTLGYQKKNLFNFADATWLNQSGSVTVTKKAESITIKSLNTWASATYKLPELEVGIPYTFSTVISDFAKAEGADTTRIKIRLSYDTGGTNPIEDINISADGAYEVTFTPSSKTAYIIFYPNYSGTVYENTYTASEIMLRYACIEDDTYEPYVDDVDTRITENKSDIVINKTTLGYQKKNLCPVNSKTMSANGWVMGGGGTDVYKVYIPKGKYILTFKQTAIGQSEIQFFNSTNTQITRVLPYASTENSSLKFTITLSEDCYGMKFYNNSGVNTYSNIMIRDAAITDATFEPYVESVDERLNTNETEITKLILNKQEIEFKLDNVIRSVGVNQADIAANKSEIALNKTTLGFTKKNLLKNNAKSTTVQGVTITVNDDKSITVSGANTGGAIWHNVYGTQDIPMTELEIGQSYILSGTPTDNLDNNEKRTAYLRIEKRSMVITSDSKGEGAEFTVTSNVRPEYVILYIGSGADYTDRPITFYPMIRHVVITDGTYEPYVKSVDDRLQLLEVSPTINDVQIKGDIDSVDDLKIAGKCVGPDHGEIFNSYNNTATGIHAHAEGVNTHAEGDFSHAEGHSTSTTANGAFSHVQGDGTVADSFYSFVTGRWNIIDSDNKYAFIIGNGTSSSSRSNAFAIDWYGNMYLGDSTVGINLLTSQSQLYSNTTGGSSPLTVTVSNLFAEYSAVICNVVTSSGRYSLTLPLRYIKSLGTSAYYEAEGLLFYYVDDSNLKLHTGLGQSNPTINSIKLIGLY